MSRSQLARMLARRFPEPPARISYAGSVFRRASQAWEPVEHSEVGCEHICAHGENRHEVDIELARMLMAVPGITAETAYAIGRDAQPLQP